MQHWMTYVKAAYEVIMIAEDKTSIQLDQDVEAYIVHTFARYMEQPNIPTDTIAIKFMNAINEKGSHKKKQLEQIAEECILIYGPKKRSVYVKNPKGNIVKVNFGDKNMKIKKSNPKLRKSFRARHNCDNPGPRWKARYWSCRDW